MNLIYKITSKYHLNELFKFSIPLIVGQIGHMLFSIGDTFVAGKYSTLALSSVGVGSSIVSPILMFGVSSLFSVSAVSARLIGQGEDLLKSNLFATGLTLAFVFSLFISSLLFFGSPLIKLFGLHQSIVLDVEYFVRALAISVVPALLFSAVKEFLQAMHDTVFANILIIIFNGFNLLFNYIFIFGNEFLQIPSFGVIGLAYATILTRSLMFLTLFVYANLKYKLSYSYSFWRKKELLKLGLPIGLGTLVEVLMFACVTVMIGKMAPFISASHNIALNICALTFMVPLAISGAAGVKVSYAFGKKDFDLVKNYAIGCIILSELFMIFTLTIYTFIPEHLIRFFTNDTQVISYAASLFVVVAIFQIPDGLQVTMWGILRGIGESRMPMIISFMGYWIFAFPVGIFLAFYYNMQAKGLWAGLAFGLSIVSISLVFLFIGKLRGLSKTNTSF